MIGFTSSVGVGFVSLTCSVGEGVVGSLHTLSSVCLRCSVRQPRHREYYALERAIN